MTQSQPSFSCQTDVTFDSRLLWNTGAFMVSSMTARCPGSVLSKQAQIIPLPPPCLTVAMRCFSLYSVFAFYKMWRLTSWSNISALVSFVERTSFHRSCELFRCNFANISCAVIFLLGALYLETTVYVWSMSLCLECRSNTLLPLLNVFFQHLPVRDHSDYLFHIVNKCMRREVAVTTTSV